MQIINSTLLYSVPTCIIIYSRHLINVQSLRALYLWGYTVNLLVHVWGTSVGGDTSRVVLLESPFARILAPCLPMLLKDRSRLVSAVSLDSTCPITWQTRHKSKIRTENSTIQEVGTGYHAIMQAPPTSTDWELRPQRDRSRCVTLENVWEKNVTSCLDVLSFNCRGKTIIYICSFFDRTWIAISRHNYTKSSYELLGH